MKRIKITRSVIKKCAVIILGNAILAFGLYNIHGQIIGQIQKISFRRRGT